MATVTVTCTCRHCGKSFEHRASRRNTREAENYAAWAKDNITQCRDCYYAATLSKAEALVEELALPQITGASDKQISYAVAERAIYLANNADRLRELAQRINDMPNSQLPALIATAKRATGRLPADFAVLLLSDAGELLDVLVQPKTTGPRSAW